MTVDAEAKTAGLAPLLIGVLLLMLGNGLQGTLLGVRAGQAGFDAVETGVIMAGFFAGFIVGSGLAMRAVRQVGHIRVFAALTAGASITILAHAAFVDPWVWTAMRFLTGVCFAGVFVAAESWLNARASNDGRGAALSFYMFTSFAGMGGGQLLLPLADPGDETLFMLVSALISASAGPLLLSATPAPAPSAIARVPIIRLYRVSPLGFVGVFLAGVVNGAVLGMGAVYAAAISLSVEQVSLFMSAMIFGAAALQWPIGKVSDLFDRRIVITVVSIASALVALACAALGPDVALWAFLPIALYGGVALSIHALSIAYSNDYLEPSELIGASGGLVLVFGFGSTLGPLAAGAMLQSVGAIGYFVALAATHGALALFAFWRMTRRETLPADEQGPYVAVAASTSAVLIEAAEETHADQLAERTDADADAKADEP